MGNSFARMERKSSVNDKDDPIVLSVGLPSSKS